MTTWTLTKDEQDELNQREATAIFRQRVLEELESKLTVRECMNLLSAMFILGYSSKCMYILGEEEPTFSTGMEKAMDIVGLDFIVGDADKLLITDDLTKLIDTPIQIVHTKRHDSVPEA